MREALARTHMLALMVAEDRARARDKGHESAVSVPLRSVWVLQARPVEAGAVRVRARRMTSSVGTAARVVALGGGGLQWGAFAAQRECCRRHARSQLRSRPQCPRPCGQLAEASSSSLRPRLGCTALLSSDLIGGVMGWSVPEQNHIAVLGRISASQRVSHSGSAEHPADLPPTRP